MSAAWAGLVVSLELFSGAKPKRRHAGSVWAGLVISLELFSGAKHVRWASTLPGRRGAGGCGLVGGTAQPRQADGGSGSGMWGTDRSMLMQPARTPSLQPSSLFWFLMTMTFGGAAGTGAISNNRRLL